MDCSNDELSALTEHGRMYLFHIQAVLQIFLGVAKSQSWLLSSRYSCTYSIDSLMFMNQANLSSVAQTPSDFNQHYRLSRGACNELDRSAYKSTPPRHVLQLDELDGRRHWC